MIWASDLNILWFKFFDKCIMVHHIKCPGQVKKYSSYVTYCVWRRKQSMQNKSITVADMVIKKVSKYNNMNSKYKTTVIYSLRSALKGVVDVSAKCRPQYGESDTA